MAYREFLDSRGRPWRVWSTVPSAGPRLHGGFDQGWLTFECTGSDRTAALRRLVPIPSDWETASDEKLERMCQSADVAGRPTISRQRDRSPESAEP